MIRPVKTLIRGKMTSDGAGVKLKRIFGYRETALTDPFLMLDDFGSDDPSQYIAGFPWHPHRGIETVTYMLKGRAEHRDSLGNKGSLQSGDVQWMTAGSGIIHEEMPKAEGSGLRGFQLWVNLPASHKMMPPRYQNLAASEIPEVTLADNLRIRIVSGQIGDIKGPVRDIVCDPIYLDFHAGNNAHSTYAVASDHTALMYVYQGTVHTGPDMRPVAAGELAVLGDGDTVEFKTEGEDTRFLLLAGKPIRERIAWHGPIVMNTDDELERAFQELENGTFLKTKG